MHFSKLFDHFIIWENGEKLLELQKNPNSPRSIIILTLLSSFFSQINCWLDFCIIDRKGWRRCINSLRNAMVNENGVGLKVFFHPPLRLNGLKRRAMPLKRVKACAFGEGGVWRKGTGHFGKRKSAHRYFGRRIRGVWPATETYYFRGVVDYPSCESNSVGASTDRRATFPLGFGKPLGN